MKGKLLYLKRKIQSSNVDGWIPATIVLLGRYYFSLTMPKLGTQFTSHFYSGAEFVGLDAIQDLGDPLETQHILCRPGGGGKATLKIK